MAAPISALKTTLPSVDAGEGAAGADEFGDPGLVEQSAVAGQRGDADLLGEHRHAGRHDRRPVSSLRMRRTSGSGATSAERALGDHERLVGADLAGGAPAGFEEPPEQGGGLGGADDRGAAAAGPAGPVGEGADGSGRGADGDEVGAGVAEGAEPAVGVPAPHLAAEAPGVEPGDLDAGR